MKYIIQITMASGDRMTFIRTKKTMEACQRAIDKNVLQGKIRSVMIYRKVVA